MIFTNVDDGYKIYEPIINQYFGGKGEKIVEIDPSFPLIHQKIGVLKLFQSLSVDDESLINEATESLRIGFNEIRNLGVNLVNDNEELDSNIDEATFSWFQSNTTHD